MSKLQALVINNRDNVATAITDLKDGAIVVVSIGEESRAIKLHDSVSLGHKFSITPIEANSAIIKYGEVIGYAIKPIEAGVHVHIHNVLGNRGRGDLSKESI